RMQMQLQFKQERREWAQHETALLRGWLAGYEGTASDDAPRQSRESDDDRATTHRRQSAILVHQSNAVDETGTPAVGPARARDYIVGPPQNQPPHDNPRRT